MKTSIYPLFQSLQSQQKFFFYPTFYLLTLWIIIILSGCNNDKSVVNNLKDEVGNKTVYVTNTAEDIESPWLAFRDQPNENGNLIYMLPDGTKLKILGEDSTGSFVKVQLIENIGYVSKKYLSDSLFISNINNDILEISRIILKELKKRNMKIIVKYMHGNTMNFFYWKLNKYQLLNGSYLNVPNYNGIAFSGLHFTTSIYDYLDFSEWNINFLRNDGPGFFPAAGFGDGSMVPVDKEDYVVRVADPNLDMPGHELWFVYKKLNNTYKLKTIGDWLWTP
jgi:hypothetical protein